MSVRNRQHIGCRVRIARIEAGLTNLDFAKLLDLSAGRVRGIQQQPGMRDESLQRIAAALKKPLEYFLHPVDREMLKIPPTLKPPKPVAAPGVTEVEQKIPENSEKGLDIPGPVV